MADNFFICNNCGIVNYGEQVACLRCNTPMPITPQSTPDNLCPRCGQAIIPGTRFCQNCGARLVGSSPQSFIACRQCGNQVPAGKKFCNRCGARL